MRRGTLLAGVALVALATLRPAPAAAFTDGYFLEQILLFLQTYVSPILTVLDPVPPPPDGGTLTGTQAKAPEAGALSWGTLSGGPGKFAEYYPRVPEPDTLTPLGSAAYVDRHFQGTTLQAAQETDLAADTMADNEAATARLDAYSQRLPDPEETLLGAIKLHTAVSQEAAEAAIKSGNLGVQVLQALADAEMRTEHNRQVAMAYARKALPQGFEAGEFALAPGGGGGGGVGY
jgi:hypothetical protein